jgi:hypothetical protein
VAVGGVVVMSLMQTCVVVVELLLAMRNVSNMCRFFRRVLVLLYEPI